MLSEKKKAQLRAGREFEESGWTDETRETPQVSVGDGVLIKDSKWGDDYWFGVVHKIDPTWKYVCLTGLFGCMGHVLQPDEINKVCSAPGSLVVKSVRDMSEVTKAKLFLDFKEVMSGESTKVMIMEDYTVDPEIRQARIDADKAKRKSRSKKTS